MAGEYAKRIRQLRLYKRLEQSWKEDSRFAAEDVNDLTALIGNVADEVGPLLKRIPVTFQQYTEHDIAHSCNVINLMERFIPEDTLRQLNPLELSLLMLSALLHDIGMAVKNQEKEEALSSDEFRAFLMRHREHQEAIEDAESQGQIQRSMAIKDTLLAEYFRGLHSERVWDRLETDKLKSLLMFGEYDISPVLGRICESHSWPVSYNSDPSNKDKCVARLSCATNVGNTRVNEQFIACCLRLGDILDFDRSRTPLSVFNYIDFTEEKSWEEWNKHLSISGWEISESNVSFSAECTHTTFFVAVTDFIDDIDNELAEIHYVLSEAPRTVPKFYRLNLPRLADRRKIRMKDPRCVAEAFRFNLDYEGIMRLLMDKSLYPDPSLFLRELLQNSLDACRRKEALAREAERMDAYAPRICVWDHSKDAENPRIVFQDNGIGMSQHILENYFMRVGRSYYRSSEFDAERARLAKRDIELDACSSFGIGILSCFLVADRFEVETYQHNYDPLHVEIEGANKYFIITRLDKPESQMFEPKPESDMDDGPPKRTGTRVTVYLRTGCGDQR